MIAGKKVGSAVARNRAKRRLRAALRSVHLPEGELIAIVASPAVLEARFDRLVGWLAEALEPARV